MRKALSVLLLLVSCAVVLAACGSSGSSTTTASNTVPAGQLGDAACPPPKISGFDVAGFGFTGISCGDAQSWGVTVAKTQKLDGWTCAFRISGRQTTNNCKNNADGSKTLNITVRAL
jgi:hypothetical protein